MLTLAGNDVFYFDLSLALTVLAMLHYTASMLLDLDISISYKKYYTMTLLMVLETCCFSLSALISIAVSLWKKLALVSYR